MAIGRAMALLFISLPHINKAELIIKDFYFKYFIVKIKLLYYNI
jgi:hypothetical protein